MSCRADKSSGSVLPVPLATNPSVLLCDEATSALDPTLRCRSYCFCRRLIVGMASTIVLITHEMSVIQKSVTRWR
ncbi:ABC transporter, ATP-binding protein [Klebsiella pneumoniae]|uniref:ABC transporter, ATP-binding protein n=1 Tax=Klebsiella pneumoniae TaxID=573 RepID=A0A2X3EZP9_KLEPN|nr:ABC transporter, ATP-binding protein [Klebsiella pneumoniae]